MARLQKKQKLDMLRRATEMMKNIIQHDTSTMRAASTQIILSAAGVHGSPLCPHDVSQAYLKSKEKLSRPIFI